MRHEKEEETGLPVCSGQRSEVSTGRGSAQMLHNRGKPRRCCSSADYSPTIAFWTRLAVAAHLCTAIPKVDAQASCGGAEFAARVQAVNDACCSSGHRRAQSGQCTSFPDICPSDECSRVVSAFIVDCGEAISHTANFPIQQFQDFEQCCRGRATGDCSRCATCVAPSPSPSNNGGAIIRDVVNCDDAIAPGVYTVNGITTYCDTETDGGGWELFVHTENGQIPGPLSVNGGVFDPRTRRGQANTALGDIISGYPEGSVEIAIAWGSQRTKYKQLSSYEAAVAFFLPLSHCQATPLPPHPTETAKATATHRSRCDA